MSNHEHYKKICAACESIIEQCRCFNLNKSTIYSICDKCKDKAISPEVFVKRFIYAYEGNRNQLLESDLRELYHEAKRIEGVLHGRV